MSVRDLGHWLAGRGWGLDLSVRDLGHWLASSRRCLHLSVRDLSDGLASGRWCLDLSVGNLRNGLASSSWGLHLSVRDLGDGLGLSSDDLWLAISVLRDGDGNGGGSLRLSIRDLCDWGSSTSSGWLSVRGLSDGATGHDADEDRLALGSPGTIVQVVKGSTQAFVEDSRGAESERAVRANRETSSVDGSSLGRSIELELVVGRNISGSALSIVELAIGEGESKVASLSASRSTLMGFSIILIVEEDDIPLAGNALKWSCRSKSRIGHCSSARIQPVHWQWE